jgi:hypothetical protein
VKRPPRLVARTLAVTFGTVAVILTVVFIVLTVDVRERVRSAETDKLLVSERVFNSLEARRQQEQLAAVSTLAENPALKAALDTYATELRFSGTANDQARATAANEIERLAALTGGDVLAIVGGDGRVFTSAGRLRDRWPGDVTIDIPDGDQPTFQSFPAEHSASPAPGCVSMATATSARWSSVPASTRTTPRSSRRSPVPVSSSSSTARRLRARYQRKSPAI